MALSWEVLWRLRSTLALGASAFGTSITLAATMAGMTAGSFVLAGYVADVEPVTDDNQRLAYGLRGTTRLSMLHIARGSEELSNQLMVDNLKGMAPFVKRPLYLPGAEIMRRQVVATPWGSKDPQ